MTAYMSAEEARALISAAAYRAATELGRAELQSQTIAEYDGFMAAHEAAIRADERERAAERLDAVLDHRSWCAAPPHSRSACNCGREIALDAVRGEDQS